MPCRDTTEHDRHAGAVSSMFSRIAAGYDRANRTLSFGVDILWRRRLVRTVGKHLAPRYQRRVLDLAAGTLDVSLALVAKLPRVSVLAMDFCLPMLLAGKPKLDTDERRERIRCVTADGRHLPLKDASVDAITVSFGLRNILPRDAALEEAHRVLVPGGCLHILEFGSAKSRIWGGLYNWYLHTLLPFIGGLVAGDREAYTYLARTVTDFPPAEVLGRELEHAGFTEVSWERLWGGIVYLHTARKCHESGREPFPAHDRL